METESDILNVVNNIIDTDSDCTGGAGHNTNNSPVADDTIKKKPGRPKKKINAIPIEIHGIVDKPVNDEDLLELVYCNPNLFKKLLHLYKQYDVSEVEMNFDPTGVKIITKDHLDKSTIYTTIDGRCMNFYYCKSPMRVCVKCESLEKVLATLGKTHYKITFILKENYRSVMYLIIKDLEYCNDDSYEIDIVFKPENPVLELKDDDTHYPIKFKISSKHFKSKINHIKKLSSTFTIQKYGTDPLQFTYDHAQKVNWTGVYNDPSKIELQSNLLEGDNFSVSVHIDHVRPFSSSNIGEEIFIAADKHKKMSFMTRLDEKKDIGWAVLVKIFTEIKGYQPSLHEY